MPSNPTLDLTIPESLTLAGKKIAEAIVEHVTKDTDRFSCGGCTAFHDPKAPDFGFDSGYHATLVVCHDGGDLARHFNYDYEDYDAIDAMIAMLEPLGYYVECHSTCHSAIYQIPSPNQTPSSFNVEGHIQYFAYLMHWAIDNCPTVDDRQEARQKFQRLMNHFDIIPYRRKSCD